MSDISNDSKALTMRMGYDTDGSPVFTRDALNHQTSLSYADSFSDSNNSRNTFAYPSTLSDADGFSSTVQYNFDFGAKTRAQGPPPAGQSQGAIQTISYDTAARVQQVTNANNGAYTRYVYGPNYVQNFSSVNNVADDAYSIQVFDGAGRVMGAVNNHPGSTGGYSMVNIIYDLMGRAVKQSNPTEINGSWVPSGDDAAGVLYTQQTYDWKGRPLITTNTDTTTRQASYGGCGCAGSEVVTLTDEVGRRQKVYSDVLGRTAKTEVLNLDGSVYSAVTNTYNARDQVTLARQYAGAEGSGTYQDTTMGYDGYGRLQTRHAPEQNVSTATVYSYNNDDTVYSVTDARGATCTYGYNGRHLVTSATHTLSGQSTITTSYSYDAAGNRTSMTDGSGSVSYNYNELSRMTSETRTFNGFGSYTLGYAYNLAGELTGITDPFGGSLSYGFDTTGRLNTVNGSGYGSVSQFAYGAQYRAWGGLKSLSYNTSRSLSMSYDARMQPTLFQIVGQYQTVGSEYQYYADGQISYSRDLTEPVFDRSYSYDHVGRVTASFSGSEARGGYVPDGPYRQTYGYDAWGNLSQRTGRDWSHNSSPVTFTYDISTNRNSQWQYDPEGNITGQGTRQYSYDSAGRQARTSDAGNYTNQDFDGDGSRVKRSGSGWAVYYLRSTALGGEIVAELNAQGQFSTRYVYANGKLLAEQTLDGQVTWKHRSPNNNTEWNSGGTGGWRFNEYDPLGTQVGTEDPYLDGGGYGDWRGGSGVPSDLTTGCSWEGMAIGCQWAVKATNWRGSGGLTINYRSIPGVGMDWQQTTHVRSRAIGYVEDSGEWSAGDIIQFRNFIPMPDQFEAGVVRVQPHNPYRDSNSDCSIEIRFQNRLSPGAPRFSTGPNHTKLGEFTGKININSNTWSVYGFRFEVTGSVSSGSIGQIGDPRASTSIRLGNGQWQIGQWKFPFPESNRNGVPPPDAGRTTDDSPRYPSGPDQTVSVRGRNFAWNDEPGFNGPPDDPVRSADFATNFIVYAQNGDKRCAVSFHIVGSFTNGAWHATIGPGLLP